MDLRDCVCGRSACVQEERQELLIWVTAISVTLRNVHIPAGSVAHNLTRAVDQ
jgi:hypothetical protein